MPPSSLVNCLCNQMFGNGATMQRAFFHLDATAAIRAERVLQMGEESPTRAH